MTGLDKIIRDFQATQNIINSVGISSQLTDLVKVVKPWNDAFAGFNSVIDIGKSISEKLAPLYEFQQRFQSFPKLVVPDATYDAIRSITVQHSVLFTHWTSISETIKNSMVLSQMNSLQFALSSLSSQVATLSAAGGNWDLIDDFEEITSEAASISERVIEQEAITKQDIKEIKDFLGRIEITVGNIDNKDKSVEAIIFKWIAIISFILALISEARVWLPKPDAATKEDLEIFKKDIAKTLDAKLRKEKEYRTMNRTCSVYLKPKSKSRVIATLENGLDVVVLQVSHKWVYISYINPTDNLAETGWVLKKYLTQPK